MTESLFFQPGARAGVNDRQCFFFDPIDDRNVEPTEDLTLMASSPNRELQFLPLGDTAVVDIIDNGEQ